MHLSFANTTPKMGAPSFSRFVREGWEGTEPNLAVLTLTQSTHKTKQAANNPGIGSLLPVF
jgi:hypothetical protein